MFVLNSTPLLLLLLLLRCCSRRNVHERAGSSWGPARLWAENPATGERDLEPILVGIRQKQTTGQSYKLEFDYFDVSTSYELLERGLRARADIQGMQASKQAGGRRACVLTHGQLYSGQSK